MEYILLYLFGALAECDTVEDLQKEAKEKYTTYSEKIDKVETVAITL